MYELTAPAASTGVILHLGASLARPGVTPVDAFAATSHAASAVVICNGLVSESDTTEGDMIAQDLSFDSFVVGSRVRLPSDFNLALVGVLWELNGRIITTATSAAAPHESPTARARSHRQLPGGSGRFAGCWRSRIYR